jgi:hypothetical protein
MKATIIRYSNIAKNIYLNHKTIVSVFIISIFITTANILPLVGLLPRNPVNYRVGLSAEQKVIIFDGQHTIDPNDGFTSQALGRQAADQWIDLKMPLWNEYEGIGFPLAAGMQSAALFPLVVFNFFEKGFLYIQLILQLVAGIATYLFIKRLKINNIIAISGGVAYALCGTMAWLHNAAFNPVAFLPLLMLGVEQVYMSALSKKPFYKGWVTLALSIALSIYSGFPETVLIYSVLPLGWALIRFYDLHKRLRVDFVKKILIGGTVGLLLAAPIILLFLNYVTNAYTGEHGGSLASFSFDIYALPALIMPYIYGPIFGNLTNQSTISFWSNIGGYLQLSVFVLAIFSFFNKSINKKITIFFGLVCLIFLLRMYGFPFVTEIINLIPGFSLVAFYRYAFPGLIFSMIVLAALGIGGLARAGKQKVLLILSVFYFLVAILIVIASKISLAYTGSDIKKLYLLSILLVFFVILIISFSKLLNKQRAILLLSLLIIFESFVLYVIPQLSARRNTLELGSIQFLKSNLGDKRFYSLGPIEPNYGSYFNIASINNNDLPVPKNWANYIENNLNSKTDPILFTGNFSYDSNPLTPLGEFIKNIENYKELATKYLVVNKSMPNKSLLEENGLTLRYSDSVVDIYEIPGPKSYYEVTEGNCTLNVISKVKVTANCDNDSVLLRRELYMEGWKANSVSVKPGGDDDIFQVINLNKGNQIIEYNYEPPYIRFSVVLFAIAASSIAGSFIYSYIIYRKKIK